MIESGVHERKVLSGIRNDSKSNKKNRYFSTKLKKKTIIYWNAASNAISFCPSN